MNGLLVVDKPVGPTSHDVVAKMRRVLGERRIGHTGTLDPRASGVLPLVVGRATRLSRFLSASDKSYEAVVELGSSTSTYDAEGASVGDTHEGPWPTPDEVERALDAFRGTFWQRPPVYSAKKVAGRRSYKAARAAARTTGPGSSGMPPEPAPVQVSVYGLELAELSGRLVTIRLVCSSGFYVRSLAHDLGERIGLGAHLAALRRTRSGDLSLADAHPLEMLERDRAAAAAVVIPMERMLLAFRGVQLSEEGVRRAVQGRELGPADFAAQVGAILPGCSSPASIGSAASGRTRLLGPDGTLIGLAEPAATPGFLHPSIVLV